MEIIYTLKRPFPGAVEKKDGLFVSIYKHGRYGKETKLPTIENKNPIKCPAKYFAMIELPYSGYLSNRRF